MSDANEQPGKSADGSIHCSPACARSSPAKAAANRRNAQRSTGPRDTGRTRHNATRHGLLAEGLTELDDPAHYRATLAALTAEWKPAGTVEAFLVRRLALCLVRTERAARLEAEHVNAHRCRGDSWEAIVERVHMVGVDSIAHGSVKAETVSELADGFLRYEAAFQSMFFRSLRELRELQRDRRGANRPPSVPAVASFGKTAPEKSASGAAPSAV